MYELRAQAHFDAAHFLAHYHGKCENLHGHRWRVEARIAAETLQEEGDEAGMVVDFAAFKRELRELAAAFDHAFIVEEGTLADDTLACLQREGFALTTVPWRTTAENFARHFADELSARGYHVTAVEVDETPENRAIYCP